MIDRYSRKEMQKIWSEETKFNNMLKVELACSKAFSKMGIVPLDEFENMIKNARVDVNKIHEYEEITKHDVIAFTKAVSDNLGLEKRWFHYGLTSTDVVDTAQSVTLQEVNNLLEEDMNAFLRVLKNKALEYKDVPCMGRTHGMHAEITSFGLKWVLWYDEMQRNLERFEKARRVIEVGKISGAVGNYANVDPLVEEEVCRDLGLSHALISTQVLSRDRHTEYMCVLGMIASTLEKIATEIRHLSRSEVHEVEEAFSSGQKGSSAMPHKRNPISSENICGCSRVVRSYVNVAFEDNILWHERDISHSSVERIVLADASTLIDYMLNRYSKVLQNLVVFKERMIDNINLTKGVIYSGQIVARLVEKGLSRTVSYDMVQKAAFEISALQIDFKQYLKKSKINEYLTDEEIDDCFNIKYYFKNVDMIYRRLSLEA